MLKIFYSIVFGLIFTSFSVYSKDKDSSLDAEKLLEQTEAHFKLLQSIQFYDTLIAYSQKEYGPLKELQHLKYISQSKQYNAINDSHTFLMINGMLISQFPQDKKEQFIALFQKERDKLKQQLKEPRQRGR